MVAERRSTLSAGLVEAVGGHAEYARLIEAGKRAPEPEVELVCPRCKGAGWLRHDLQPGQPGFGNAVECPCGLVAARRAQVYRAASRIPEEYADLDLTTFPDQRIAGDLFDWWYQPSSPWLILAGDVGTGKTGLMIGLVKKALADGRPALFRPFVELLSDIRATYRSRDAQEPDEAALVGACKSVDVFALDDMGAARVTGWAEERLFEILNHRYNERRRTILSTNLGPAELEEYLGDRIFSRVNGMGWLYGIVGPNLREQRHAE